MYSRYMLKLLRLKAKNLNNQQWNKKFHASVKKLLGIDVGFGSYGYMELPWGTKIGNFLLNSSRSSIFAR